MLNICQNEFEELLAASVSWQGHLHVLGFLLSRAFDGQCTSDHVTVGTSWMECASDIGMKCMWGFFQGTLDFKLSLVCNTRPDQEEASEDEDQDSAVWLCSDVWTRLVSDCRHGQEHAKKRKDRMCANMKRLVCMGKGRSTVNQDLHLYI